jgi:hypothetical protein
LTHNDEDNSKWSIENPHLIYEFPLQSLKVGVWDTLSARIMNVAIYGDTNNSKGYTRHTLQANK